MAEAKELAICGDCGKPIAADDRKVVLTFSDSTQKSVCRGCANLHCIDLLVQSLRGDTHSADTLIGILVAISGRKPDTSHLVLHPDDVICLYCHKFFRKEDVPYGDSSCQDCRKRFYMSKEEAAAIVMATCYMCYRRFEEEDVAFGKKLCKNCRNVDIANLDKECLLCDDLLSKTDLKDFQRTCQACRNRRGEG